jgi:hypothetical protein
LPEIPGFTREGDFAKHLTGRVAPAVVEEQESSAALLLLVQSISVVGVPGV